MNYWFRPKRWGKWVAVYHPVSWQGWVVTLVLLGFGAYIFRAIDVHSHSVSDTLFAFAPWAIAIMCLFDLACFRKGEYPWWWKKQEKKNQLIEPYYRPVRQIATRGLDKYVCIMLDYHRQCQPKFPP